MQTIAGKFVPVMITPFDLKADIDLDVVNVLIDFYLHAGVKGIFANCLSSEMFSISEAERLQLTWHIVRYVNGRVPVVATGSFGLTLEDKADFTKKIYDTGINAVILVSGHFAKLEERDDILLKNFDKMFSLTGDIPLGIYECPAPYKRVLSAAVFTRLLEADRLVYHKDTSITPQNVKAKLDALKQAPNRLEFYDAHTPNAMFSMQNGALGMSSISGNFYPEIMVWMTENANNPDRQEDVKWLQQELAAVDPMIHIAYPMSAKYFLQKRGLPVRTISRAYALHLTPGQKQEVDALYNKFLSWCQRLGIEPIGA